MNKPNHLLLLYACLDKISESMLKLKCNGLDKLDFKVLGKGDGRKLLCTSLANLTTLIDVNFNINSKF